MILLSLKVISCTIDKKSKYVERMSTFQMHIIARLLVLLAVIPSCKDRPPHDICEKIWEKKATLDSLFTPTAAVGSVVKCTNESFPDHNNFTFVEIIADSKYPFVGQETELRQLQFWDPRKLRLGLRSPMEGQIAKGDIFVKPLNSPIFYIIKPSGDTLITEMEFVGFCDGRNCFYERIDGNLCYQGW